VKRIRSRCRDSTQYKRTRRTGSGAPRGSHEIKFWQAQLSSNPFYRETDLERYSEPCGQPTSACEICGRLTRGLPGSDDMSLAPPTLLDETASEAPPPTILFGARRILRVGSIPKSQPAFEHAGRRQWHLALESIGHRLPGAVPRVHPEARRHLSGSRFPS
jgi:hypothetical protein